MGAIWGAALLVLLPNWSNDIGHSFSLPGKVSSNLPLAIYGVVLIVAMLVWPSGIQGAVRAGSGKLWSLAGRGRMQAPTGGDEVEEPQVPVEKPRVAS
jgi:branched-chain amino acid transport system permease protein